MKKLFFSLLLLCIITTTVHAQVTNEPNPMAHTPATQPENNAYWYYPAQNLYYNQINKQYWYYDRSNFQWKQGTELVKPYTPLTDNDAKYQVNGGQDIWKLNDEHKTKYQVQKPQ